MTLHRVIIGDSRDMSELDDQSVHLVVTSPPYWQLKDYGASDQIGYNHTYEDYINNLSLVWNHCHRVLHKGCRLCVNIGDQFARSVYYGRYKVIPIRTEIIKFCETVGFDYMGAIIWQKATTCHTSGGATIMGSFPYPRNGIIKLDYEFILVFKKLGRPPRPTAEQIEKSKLSKQEWNELFYGHWNFPGEKQDKHLAMFPAELPRRLIRMFTFWGDTVLDPFLGSGTTVFAARQLGRNSVGYEVNGGFVPTIEKKLGLGSPDMFHDATVSIEFQERRQHDYAQEIARLPYVFRDPLPIQREVDPKKLRFGSRIDGSETGARYHAVARVLSPNRILLDSGLEVDLLGIEPLPGKAAEAASLLEGLTEGHRVEIRTDASARTGNRPAVYLYLANRTFVNAKLIKSGLVRPDTRRLYRWREKFVEYARQARQRTCHGEGVGAEQGDE